MKIVEPKSVTAFVKNMKKFCKLLQKQSPMDVVRNASTAEEAAQLSGALLQLPYEFNNQDQDLVFKAAALFATQISPITPMRGRVQVVCILDRQDKPVYIDDWVFSGKSILAARGFVLTSTNPSDIGKTNDYLLYLSSFYVRRGNPYTKFANYRLSGGFVYSTDSVHMILPKADWFFNRNKLLQTEEYKNIGFLTPGSFMRYFVRKED